MGSFKRSIFGYRRTDVDGAIAARDAHIQGLEAERERRRAAIDELERETASLSGMVIEREREIRTLGERLREVNAWHDRSIASLDAVTARLEEMQEQARGQATRIRMKALREAVEVSRRVQALTESYPAAAEAEDAGAVAAGPRPIGEELDEVLPPPPPSAEGVFEGRVRLEIGPLGDFAQLVGFEDAVGRLGASEISVERFSEGRATLSVNLDQPVELLRELERLSALDFKVRHNAPDNVVLDLDAEDEPGPGKRAA